MADRPQGLCVTGAAKGVGILAGSARFTAADGRCQDGFDGLGAPGRAATAARARTKLKTYPAVRREPAQET